MSDYAGAYSAYILLFLYASYLCAALRHKSPLPSSFSRSKRAVCLCAPSRNGYGGPEASSSSSFRILHLAFGSLALSFDAYAFHQLRKTVVERHENEWLVDVIKGLLLDFETASSKVCTLQTAGTLAQKQLADLHEAFTTGRPLDTPYPLPNALLIPLIVITQLTQYGAFLRQLGIDTEGHAWAASKTNKETLGLCTGLLSAFAISSAQNFDEFRTYGAVAVRLGMLVGLMVDSQDATSARGRSRSLSAAWSPNGGYEAMERILNELDGAYISVHYDANRATITSSTARILDLTRKLKAAGISTSEIGLYGSFHSANNSKILDDLLFFCDSHPAFQLPDAASLAIPVRAGDGNANLFRNGSLHFHALRSILLEPPRWFDIFWAALQDKGDNVQVFSFGPERSVPPSLTSKVGMRVHHFADQNSKADGRGNRPWLDSDIAVVGMACKVPGADNLEEFWDLLVSGESQHNRIDAKTAKSSRFCFDDTPYRTTEDSNMDREWYANLIDGYDQFDHRFFKKSARDSATMDPQQRHMLQVAYQAIEQSGYFKSSEAGRDAKIGCFVGVCQSDYEKNVACHAANAFTATGNLQAFLAGKVSHFFGWTGPGLTIDTACSSSLVAVHQACHSILSGECNMALAGGTHIMSSVEWFQNLAAGSFLSPTGQCKPFDAKADGYCRGEGVGAVFLKRMSQAVADGDPIMGVIAATAVQQNQNCTPVFVPNVPSLSDLFTTVTTKARVRPSQISVVEAHGTGTPVGDPAEYNSIRQVLGGTHRGSGNPLMVSSVKGLVGHLECTSGIISLVKVVLMLSKGMLPPQASFNTMNPALNPSPSDKMFIPTHAQPWDTDFRAALINNYGASGSNASMVVIQAPSLSVTKEKDVVGAASGAKYPFWISGLDDKSLRRYAKAFRKFLVRSAEDTSLANISFNLAHQSNRNLDRSLIFTVGSIEELDKNLSAFEKGDANISSTLQPSAISATKVVLCFGGQVSTYIGLDCEVYHSVAILRKHLNHVDDVVQSLGYESIFPEIFESTPISNTVQLQTMLFAMQYACARCWMDSGIQPAALVGHSFGELTALCISEVLSLEDTIRMIVSRASLVRDAWGADKGAMMAIEADLSDVEKLLIDANNRHSDKPASIACYNGPRSFTLAGSTTAIDTVATQLQELSNKSVKSKRLSVTNAFHSALVDPILDRLEHSAQSLTFRKPVIPLELARKDILTSDLTPRFVADHMRNPVYYHHAVERLARRHSQSPCVFLEAGTNSTVTSMASRALKTSGIKGIRTFQGLNIATYNDGWNKLTESTVSLWKAGLRVQHWAHHGLQRRYQTDVKPLLLPPYQFDPDSRHWMELKTPPKHSPTSTAEQSKASPETEGPTTFMGFQDGPAQKEALFRINTTTEKYKKLLSGHLTIQTAPICPATVQIGFVIDAIGTLRPEYRTAYQPQIQDVEYKSPVCQNSARATWIEVKNDAQGGLEWQFEIFSTENQAQSRMLHTIGKIIFRDGNDKSLRHQLVLFERLFGHHRATELLQSADADEVLTNRNIYRIFAEVVDYGDEFRGMQKLASRGNESAGHVIRKNPEDLWFDAHLVDTFCQLGGLWINCMTERSQNDVYLANAIDQWIRAPLTKWPNEFHAVARHHCPSDKLSLTDVFIFDAANGALVEVILGIAYVKIPKLSMEKLLTRLSEPSWVEKISSSVVQPAPVNTPRPSIPSTVDLSPIASQAPRALPTIFPTQVKSDSQSKSPKLQQQAPGNDYEQKVKAVIADLSGLELDEIKDDSELADLGIDSLTGMEMVHEIEKTLKVKLPEIEILAVNDMPSLMKCVAGALGIGMDTQVLVKVDESNEGSDVDATSTTSSADGAGVRADVRTPATESHLDEEEFGVTESSELKLSFATVIEAFHETKKLKDGRITDMGQSHYVADSLPRQNELTVALTIEAFEALGAGFRNSRPGQQLSRISHGKDHMQFVTYLYEMLEARTQIIKVDGDRITRTEVLLPQRHSKDLYEKMLARFPDQHPADKLTYYAGVNLARVLSGETDGGKLIFGCPEGRDLLSAFYAEWPLNRVLYAQMEDFLTRLTSKLRVGPNGVGESRPLRILEMGAGAGDITKRLVPFLAQLGVSVEYTFSDPESSFVAAARKKWGNQYPWMKFRALDNDKAPEQDLVGTQHFVIAINAGQATHSAHSLLESAKNIRYLLRLDGFLFMLGMTRTPDWVNLIFGLSEGSWLYDDGRRHTMACESRWKKDLQAIGYGHVDWTDGVRPESDIEKLILASADTTSRCERVMQTTINYCPKNGASTDCVVREQVVANYVRDLTQGFAESMNNLPSPVATSVSESNPRDKCILITGATGGLGAHLVAEAALRKDVERVVCLNRPNKEDPWQRQMKALSKKGIELPTDIKAKIVVFETDLSNPTNLGLSNDNYRSLLDSVTHIVHNAWLMHSKWPVRRFEPQLRIMKHMISLARDISARGRLVTFEFISSIAAVGHHPLWTGNPVVPEERVPIDSVLPTGYGDAKYICERMLDATLHLYPDRFRATAVRLGQIAGSSINGHWNPMEHVSFMIKSSQTLRALPDLPGSMGWTPADDVARTLVEILTQPDKVTLHPIYHIENPVRQPWRDVINVLANVLEIPQNPTGIIPFEEWLQRVRDWPRREDNGPEGANPGYLLVDFLDANFVRISCGGLLLGTAKAREHSPTLANLGPISESLIRLFVSSWKNVGFLA